MPRPGAIPWLGAILLLGAMPILPGCGRSDDPARPLLSLAPSPDRGRSSALLVTLDTFRADAAGCGGNPVARTPHLDRLARTGVQFESGVATTPLTLPSHATMHTGLNPPAHGVRDNGTFRLAPDIPTLAESLAQENVATAAFITAFPLERRFGLDRGFTTYDDAVRERTDGNGMLMAQRPGAEAVDAATCWWDGQRSGRWFTWLHLFDAHSPYEAPAPLLQACAGNPYLADVSVADAQLGRAVRAARLRTEHLRILVLGDHGEGLGDHDEMTHGLFIYGSTMRVPAVIWPAPAGEAPGPRPRRFRMQDVGATLFPLLGLQADDAPGDGADAFREEVDRPAYLESRYAFYHHGWAPLRGVIRGEWKFVDAPGPELYYLPDDPGEQANVVDDHPDVADELADLLDDLGRERGAEAPTNLDAEAQAALESLGYLTVDRETLPDAPDPKRMVRVQRMLEQAQAQFTAGRPAQSVGLLRSALGYDPANKDIHQSLGLAYSALGRHEDAVEAYRKCLSLPPHRNDRIPRFELATALIRLGRAREAIPHLEEIAAGPDPDASTFHNLGVARDAVGDHQGAREAWEHALELDPGFELSRQALQGAQRH
jgi:arylsulfatase A-like enzyme